MIDFLTILFVKYFLDFFIFFFLERNPLAFKGPSPLVSQSSSDPLGGTPPSLARHVFKRIAIDLFLVKKPCQSPVTSSVSLFVDGGGGLCTPHRKVFKIRFGNVVGPTAETKTTWCTTGTDCPPSGGVYCPSERTIVKIHRYPVLFLQISKKLDYFGGKMLHRRPKKSCGAKGNLRTNCILPHFEAYRSSKDLCAKRPAL